MTEKNTTDRHSFKRKLGEIIDMPKNQFGHTVTNGETENISTELEIVMDPNLGLRGQMSILNSSILDTVPEVLQRMMNNLPDDDPQKQILAEQLESLDSQFSTAVENCENLIDVANNEDFIKKIMEIDDEEKQSSELSCPDDWDECDVSLLTVVSKSSTINKACSKCKATIPVQAKFCTECGSSQIVKFCTQCGYQFSNEEKFCPECGTQR